MNLNAEAVHDLGEDVSQMPNLPDTPGEKKLSNEIKTQTQAFVKREEEKLLDSWNYSPSGNMGPKFWGNVSSSCGGLSQSPIDLSSKHGRGLSAQRPLQFRYKKSEMTLLNDGKFIRAETTNGGSLTVSGHATYTLRAIEFHAPSEHTVDGAASDAEIQLIHEMDNGRLAIVSVLVNVGEEPNPLMKQLWGALPRGINSNKGTAEVVDANEALTVGTYFAENGVVSYYSYLGSLTSPPCDEGVTWYILNEQGIVTREQIEEMQVVIQSRYLGEQEFQVINAVLNTMPATETDKTHIMKKRLNNARSAQPLNGRTVGFNNADANPPYWAHMSETLFEQEDDNLKKKMNLSDKKALLAQITHLKSLLGQQDEITKQKIDLAVAAQKRKDEEKSKTATEAAVKDQLRKDKAMLTKAKEAIVGAQEEVRRVKAALTPDAKANTPQREEAMMGESLESKSVQEVEGSIVFPADHLDIPGSGFVKVQAVSPHTEGKKPVMSIIEDSKFNLKLVPGKYTIESVVRGFETQKDLINIGASGKPVLVTINLGTKEGISEDMDKVKELTDHNMQFTEAATNHELLGEIMGSVVTKNNQAVKLGYVKVRTGGHHDGNALKLAVVKDGAFSIKDLAAGAYTIESNVVGHEPQFSNVMVSESTPKEVIVVV